MGTALASWDFDADGHADVAVGIPDKRLGDAFGAGAVLVLYGSPSGLTARDQWWTQDSPGVKGASESWDSFGSALAAGDLDGDGYADLAVGAPREAVGSAEQAGAVHVLYGAPTGLTAAD